LYLRRVEEEADSLIPYMCGVYIQKRPVGAARRAVERHVGGGGAFGNDPECGDGAREGDGAGVKERVLLWWTTVRHRFSIFAGAGASVSENAFIFRSG